MAEQDPIIRGEDVPPEIKAEFDSLRTVFDTKTALDRLDSYGKWLFNSAAIVGSLGAGLSNSSFGKLRGASVWSFALAVIAFGLCLVAASRSLAPQWVEVQLTNLKSLRDAVNTQFAHRQQLLTRAASLFAFALVLAALSPLLSLISAGGNVPNIHYTLDDKGTLDSGLEATGLKPGTVIELGVEVDGKRQTPASASTADETGQIKVSLKTSIAAIPSGTIDLVACERDEKSGGCAKMHRVTVLKR